MAVTYECSYCYSQYSAAGAAIACEEACETEDARQRAWVKAHPTGAVHRDTIPG